jgi:hypothetical protein
MAISNIRGRRWESAFFLIYTNRVSPLNTKWNHFFFGKERNKQKKEKVEVSMGGKAGSHE